MFNQNNTQIQINGSNFGMGSGGCLGFLIMLPFLPVILLFRFIGWIMFGWRRW